MTSIVVRRVASTPSRTASETWALIISILAPDTESPARAELAAATGVGCSAISSEATKDDPIVVQGSGPLIRVYCVFGDDAITGEAVNEDPLTQSPTEGDWSMSIPCPPEDLKWSQSNLSAASTRITARAVGEDERASNQATNDSPLTVNREEFLKP
jgi:hypothetical protein